jgi:hypothetical protein
MAEDAVVHGPRRLLFQPRIDRHREVVDAAATQAANVVVAACATVETRPMAPRMDFANSPSSARRLRFR